MPLAAARRWRISATRRGAAPRSVFSSSSAKWRLAMVYFLAGCAVLLLLLIGGRFLVRADPRRLATIVRKSGGVAALAVAGFLLMRGALPIAIPLAVFGLALVGGRNVLGFSGRPFGSAQKSPGQKSQVRTDRLEQELDHDSGHMEGKGLASTLGGRNLSSLSDREAMELLTELHNAGSREAALMEAYLDWRLPNWRDQASADDWQPRGFAEGGKTEAPPGRARAN